MARCPQCNAALSSAKAESISIDGGTAGRWHGVAYTCPSCNTFLGVEIDPIALKADIVSEVVDQIRRIFQRP